MKILILILIIILILLISQSNIQENYDARLSNITLTECGTECTRNLNCYGFGYNHVGGKCYLSKSTILGEPLESLYKDEYTKLDRRCNKINRITDNNRVDGITMTQNSVYICADGENNTGTRFQYANLGATSLDGAKTTIFDRADQDNIQPVEVAYETNGLVWPKTKEENTKLYEEVQQEKKIKKNIFIESDNEFLGQYLLPHQCSTNIPFYDCLKFCDNEKKCMGVEWNKEHSGVCCPKSIISKIIPRREQHKNGKFYVKRNSETLNERDNIVLTKSNFDQRPLIDNKDNIGGNNIIDKMDYNLI